MIKFKFGSSPYLAAALDDGYGKLSVDHFGSMTTRRGGRQTRYKVDPFRDSHSDTLIDLLVSIHKIGSDMLHFRVVVVCM